MSRDPKDKSYTKDRIEYYIELAKLAEKGKITTIFFTDSMGILKHMKNLRLPSFKEGVMLHTWSHWCLRDRWLWRLQLLELHALVLPAIFVSQLFEVRLVSHRSTAPYIVARNLSTVDHLTRGRLGWNVVTSFNTAGAEAMGLDQMIPHDERYERAHEFMDILYE